MQPLLILQLLILVAVANAMPVLAKKVLGGVLDRPLDNGAMLFDGRPLLGSSKTIRGILVSVLATPLAAVLMGLGWQIGVVVAVAAMTGDLLSSFIKRRFGLAPSSMAIGLDQIPESLLPFLAARLLLPVTFLDVAVGTAIFCVGSFAVSRILFKLNLRDEPY
jgi:CDP-diglyceride synthetase